MAELDTTTLESPSSNPIQVSTVQESREVVLPPDSPADSSFSDALDAALAKKAKEQEDEADDTPVAPPPTKTEKVEPTKPVEKAPATEVAPEVEEPDPKKRLARMIEAEQPAHEKPEEPAEEAIVIPEEVKSKKAKDRFIELHHQGKVNLTRAEAAEKLAQEREAKIKELESRAPQGIPDELKPVLEEHMQLKRRYILESTQEAKAFDAVVEDSEKVIMATLKTRLDETSIDAIVKAGGFAAFANSSSTAMLGGEEKPFSEIAKEWMDGLTLTNRRAIESAIDEQLKSKSAKRRFIEEGQASSKAYFDNQQKLHESSVQQQQQGVEQQRQQIESFKTKVLAETPWVKDAEVPANATSEQKKEVEADNKFKKGLRDYFDATLKTATLPDLLDAAMDATGYYHVRRENSKLTKRIAELEGKLSKMKSASSTTPRQSISAPKTDLKVKAVPDWMGTADAFDRQVDQLAAGGE